MAVELGYRQTEPGCNAGLWPLQHHQCQIEGKIACSSLSS